MKYPPTSEPGSPVSACQRSGSVKVDMGIGITSTGADAGRCSEANTADQPGGTGVAAAAGSGLGKIGSTASTPTDMTTAAGRQPEASQGIRRPAYAAQAARAASRQKASNAAAAPSARIENRSGSAALSSGRPCSQYHGSLSQACSCPLASSVPPSENTASTTAVTAVARTGSRRQNLTAARPSSTSSGQPR